MTFAEKFPLLVQIATFFGIIGVPTIFGLTVWCVKACIKFTKALQFISSAIKSEIRCDLIRDFEEYEQRTWCSLVEQTEWLNRYESYHNLYGENGVLDVKKKIIESMPNHPPVTPTQK